MTSRQLEFGSADNLGRESISNALSTLADLSSDATEYGAALKVLGAGLGHRLATQLVGSPNRTVYVVTTPEDMDTLGAGFLAPLHEVEAAVSVACLWIHTSWIALNDTAQPQEIAQIVQEYVEPAPADVDHLVVVTSMPSSARVLRTIMHRMLDELTPKNVYIFAPVVRAGIGQLLASERSKEIPVSLNISTFAVDADLDEFGNAFPGVGGVSYERLGFADQDHKNSILPQYVVESIRSRRELKPEPEPPAEDNRFTI